MIAVVNTGSLVYLAQLNRLSLLQDLYEPYAPSGVLDETSVWSSKARRLVQTVASDWLKVVPVTNISLRDYLIPQIDLGEAEVIALAVELGASRVLLDDQDARRSARLYELQPMGTLGLLLQAKLQGLLPALRPEIERLAQTNFYFSAALIHEILQAAGEV
jgi:predicted nucleic acid-binding protein